MAGHGAADFWVGAHMYGIRYVGTLYGFVFLSHQIGSFLGGLLGVKIYDLTGDYTMV